MPRLKNRIPKMCRYGGDKARVKIDGVSHYLGQWDSPEADAAYRAKIRQWRAAQKVQQIAVNDRVLVSELAADYTEHIQAYYGPGHNRATSIAPIIKRFGEHFASMWTDEFRPRHLELARNIWVKRKCCRTYINRATQEIVRCFAWGVTKDKVPADVWQALQAVPSLALGRYEVREAPDVQPVPISVVDATLPSLPDVVADMVRVQLLSGCRPNEIMRLSPGQIDRTGDVWKYTPVRHKNAWRKKTRTVYFGPQAQAILLKYLVRPDSQCCFLTEHGEPFARGGYRQVIRRAVQRINAQRVKDAPAGADVELLPHWVPGQLRHTAATTLRQMKNLEAARAILGHTSSTTTAIYAELNEEPAIELARKLG